MNLSLGFTSRGVWVRYFMESWFPFVPYSVTSSLPHMPALSVPVLLGKWWHYWIPEPSPSSRAQNAPSLASNAYGENATNVSGDPGNKEPSAFLSFSMGGATNCLLGAAMVRHFCSGTKSSFHLEALSRCFSWENRDQKLISFQIDWFDLLVV